MIAIVQTETSGNFYAFMTLTLVEVERCSLKSFTFKLEFWSHATFCKLSFVCHAKIKWISVVFVSTTTLIWDRNSIWRQVSSFQAPILAVLGRKKLFWINSALLILFDNIKRGAFCFDWKTTQIDCSLFGSGNNGHQVTMWWL